MIFASWVPVNFSRTPMVLCTLRMQAQFAAMPEVPCNRGSKKRARDPNIATNSVWMPQDRMFFRNGVQMEKLYVFSIFGKFSSTNFSICFW